MIILLCLCTIVFSSLRVGSMARSTGDVGASIFGDSTVISIAIVTLLEQLK